MLGIVAERRSPLRPDVPTLSEQGFKGIDLQGGLGFYGPANLPRKVVDRLNAAIAKSLEHPDVRQGFARGVYEAVASSPEELAAMTRESYERWGRIVRDLGIQPQ